MILSGVRVYLIHGWHPQWRVLSGSVILQREGSTETTVGGVCGKVTSDLGLKAAGSDT